MLLSILLATQLAGAAADPSFADPAFADPAFTDMSFADAKARADAYESALGRRDSEALVQAQGDALRAAMLTCGPAKGAYTSFTIVARVDSSGATQRTWRSEASPYAVCLDRELGGARLPVAAGKAFHVAYELSIAP